jgi:hypothetical protein
MSTDDILTRYREIRGFVAEFQSAALDSVPAAVMLEQAKRIGLTEHGALRPGSRTEMTMVFDMVVHTAKEGRTRAIDRIAKQKALPDGSLAAAAMRALQAAQFTVWRIEAPHPEAGMTVHDLLRRQSFWLMDEWLSRSAKKGDRFVARLADMGDYKLSCGVVVPFNDTVFELAASDARAVKAANAEAMLKDRRFAEIFYRAAVAGGAMHGVAFRDPEEIPG